MLSDAAATGIDESGNGGTIGLDGSAECEAGFDKDDPEHADAMSPAEEDGRAPRCDDDEVTTPGRGVDDDDEGTSGGIGERAREASWEGAREECCDGSCDRGRDATREEGCDERIGVLTCERGVVNTDARLDDNADAAAVPSRDRPLIVCLIECTDDAAVREEVDGEVEGEVDVDERWLFVEWVEAEREEWEVADVDELV